MHSTFWTRKHTPVIRSRQRHRVESLGQSKLSNKTIPKKPVTNEYLRIYILSIYTGPHCVARATELLRSPAPVSQVLGYVTWGIQVFYFSITVRHAIMTKVITFLNIFSSFEWLDHEFPDLLCICICVCMYKCVCIYLFI